MPPKTLENGLVPILLKLTRQHLATHRTPFWTSVAKHLQNSMTRSVVALAKLIPT